MSEPSSEIFLELGSSKIVLSFNDKISNKIKSKEKNILNKKGSDSLFLNSEINIIENSIYELEKENDIYIKNINLLIDDEDLTTVGLSVSKIVNYNLFEKKDLEYLIQDAKQILLRSNSKYEILHILITSFKTDNTALPHFDLSIPEIPEIACDINESGEHIISRIPLSQADTSTFNHYPFLEYSTSNRYFYPTTLDKLTLTLTQDLSGYFVFEITYLNEKVHKG